MRVERLAAAEEMVRCRVRQKLLATAGRTVEQQHGVGDFAVVPPLRRTQRSIVDLKRRECFTGGELHLRHFEDSFFNVHIVITKQFNDFGK